MLGTVKVVLGMVAGMGASTIVGNAAKCFTPRNVGVLKKMSCALGAGMLGGAAAKVAYDQTEKTVDDCVELYNDIMSLGKDDEKSEEEA